LATVKTLDDYIQLSRGQVSSAPVAYLLHLFVPYYRVGWFGSGGWQWGDQFGFSISPLCSVLAAYGVITGKISHKLFVFLVALILFALGTNGGVPQALYLLGVPFITLFRQWYHFHPYILLCISYMAVQCLCLLNSKRVVGVQGSDRVPVLQTDLRNGAALVLLFIVPMYGVLFFQSYVSNTFVKSEAQLSNSAIERDLKGKYEVIYEALPMRESEKKSWSSLFISKAYARLEAQCNQSQRLKLGTTDLGHVLRPRLVSRLHAQQFDALCSPVHGVETVTTPQGLIVHIDQAALVEPGSVLFLPYPSVLGLQLVEPSKGLLASNTGEYLFVENTQLSQQPWLSSLYFKVTSTRYPLFIELWYSIGLVIVAACLIRGKPKGSVTGF